MKTVYLMRHAKAVQEAGLLDRDRYLVERGKQDAERIARRLAAETESISVIISSPAVRALETAQVVSAVFDNPQGAIFQSPDIYEEQSLDSFLKILHELDDGHQSVLLCGHNPGINDLAERLADNFGEWMATSALVGIEFSCDAWKDVGAGTGVAVYFDYPKRDKEVVKAIQDDLEAVVTGIARSVFPKASKKKATALKRECKKAAKDIANRWGLLD